MNDIDNEYYKNQIVEMLKEISDLRDLKMIYGFVRAAYREKQKGGTHDE